MYHNIRILSEVHEVHVLSFVGSDEEQDLLTTVKPICKSIRGIRRIPDFRPHWLSLKPFLMREFSTPEMYRAVDEMFATRKIDVLQCEYLQMAQFYRKPVFSVLTLHEALAKNAYDAFKVETDPVVKFQLFYRWMQVLRYEVEQVRRFDRVVTMTEEDAGYLQSYSPHAHIRSIPIGIDAEEFSPTDIVSGVVSVVFMGNFMHSPNVGAARFLVESIAPRFPEVTFVIAGTPVPDALEAGANVCLKGYVHDTRTLYRGADTVVVAPLFSGTGQRVKLLEAFSMACPVITTRVGAMGFPVENGVHAVLAETAEEFESALRRLIADRNLRRHLGQNARAMILERFTWSRIAKEVLHVVADAVVAD